MLGVFGTPLRGMVLCAGMGSRLGELGEELPKPLLPVCNHPLLTYGLALLRGFGITEVGINLHHLGELITAALGDGRSVALLPGYGASELSMRPLEAYLRHLGYNVRDWGMGRNNGRVAADVERFAAQAAEWAKTDGAPLTLIGWSLGGVIARETARAGTSGPLFSQRQPPAEAVWPPSSRLYDRHAQR